MDETYLINLIKERLCYVSLDFLKDLEITRKRGAENTIRREYVLPDYIKSDTGYIKVLR
jgi:actin-related protein 6